MAPTAGYPAVLLLMTGTASSKAPAVPVCVGPSDWATSSSPAAVDAFLVCCLLALCCCLLDVVLSDGVKAPEDIVAVAGDACCRPKGRYNGPKPAARAAPVGVLTACL